MQKIMILFGLIGLIVFTTSYAYSQDIGLATFQETAQVIIDKSMSQNVTASVALQSTSIQETKIPAELEQKIRENGRITAIVLTNQNQCVLGVYDESCIIINVARAPADTNFPAIQNSTRKVAELFIDELNQTFDTNAEFHSIFVQTSDEMSRALETSGMISGKGTVSAQTERLPDFDDQQFALDLLEHKHVLVAPGSSFNVPYRNHFRVTNLPEPQVLAEVFGLMEELLENYATGDQPATRASPALRVVEQGGDGVP